MNGDIYIPGSYDKDNQLWNILTYKYSYMNLAAADFILQLEMTRNQKKLILFQVGKVIVFL